MKRSRDRLKSYFRKGCRPTEEQFVDLIDSTYNVIDDDIEKPIIVEPQDPIPSINQSYREVAADGEWHNIPHDKIERGLQVYRVIASYKNSRTSKCYICEVIASQHDATYSELSSPKRHWWGWRDPIEFRWRSYLGYLHLQIRCRQVGRRGDKVHYQMVQLWDCRADNNE